MKLLLILPITVFIACSQTTSETIEKNNLSESLSPEYEMLKYSELERLDIRLPYTYEYSIKNKSIFVYGSYHTSDPRDSIVKDIESRITTFKPDLILYEGDGISFESTKEKSIEYYFEMGLVRYLCNEKSIPDMNLEPHAKNKYQDLLRRHTKSEVFLATIGSQITLLLVSERNMEFGKFYSRFVNDLEREGYPITDDEKNINYFYKKYEDFYGIPFDLKTFDYESVEIKFNKTKLNQINQESARYRDMHMLKLIESQLPKYNRIYIQIGGRHAVVWEPAIKEIMERQKSLPTKPKLH